MNSNNTIILDGPITKNPIIMKLLSSLRTKQVVLKNKKEIGTSLGATNLFDMKRKNKLDTIIIKKFHSNSFKTYFNYGKQIFIKKNCLVILNFLFKMRICLTA